MVELIAGVIFVYCLYKLFKFCEQIQALEWERDRQHRLKSIEQSVREYRMAKFKGKVD